VFGYFSGVDWIRDPSRFFLRKPLGVMPAGEASPDLFKPDFYQGL
jgi:hypothetical protein